MKFENHIGETGGMAESEFLGVLDNSVFREFLVAELERVESEINSLENKKERDEVRDQIANAVHSRHSFYLPRKESLVVTREMQSDNPKEPNLLFPKLLLASIKEKINQQTEDQVEVLFYTACTNFHDKRGEEVKNSADVFHGIDAFIDFKYGKKERTITLDLSIDPKKMNRRTKANVVMVANSAEFDLDPNDEGFQNFVEDQADKVFQLFFRDYQLDESYKAA